jgi:DNA-binding NarL/FixJ family response regulator
MAFTGDLEHIHIVDIFQLLHTTRKSGTFSIKGSKGKSQLIFSNGCIVGANHLNNRIRIGTVLVKMNAITRQDLEKALDVQKKAGKDRKPLIATLIEMGKLDHDRAFKGLKKLIEMTIVELIGWTKGTFTLDTEAIAVSSECRYLPDKMEQEIGLDVQMVLMDALRIYDELERDRKAGKHVPSYEELFAEEISQEGDVRRDDEQMVITADDLGLSDIEHLEKKIPQSFGTQTSFDKEIFNPVEIHRQNIRETLVDFSDEEQEAFVSFLEKFASRKTAQTGSARLEGRTNALILFSHDKLMKHSIMTICKSQNVLVFATDKEEELDNIIDHCLLKKMVPLLVFDNPETLEGGFSDDKIIELRQQLRERFPQVSIIQLASPMEYTFMLRSYHEGIRAVIPKPLKVERRETFIDDTITFLETFKSYIVRFLHDEQDLSITDNRLGELRNRIVVLRSLSEPPDVTFALLQYVSEIFERSITFVVRPTELVGKEAIGITHKKNMGPTSVAHIKIPLTIPSVVNNVIEKGDVFYGECYDEVLREYLYKEIGEPLKPTVILLPMKSQWKILTLTYGDFGMKEPVPVQIDMLEILANQAGLVLENALYRKHLSKASKK